MYIHEGGQGVGLPAPYLHLQPLFERHAKFSSWPFFPFLQFSSPLPPPSSHPSSFASLWPCQPLIHLDNETDKATLYKWRFSVATPSTPLSSPTGLQIDLTWTFLEDNLEHPFHENSKGLLMKLLLSRIRLPWEALVSLVVLRKTTCLLIFSTRLSSRIIDPLRWHMYIAPPPHQKK